MKAADAHRIFGMPEYQAAVQGIIPLPSEQRIKALEKGVPNLRDILGGAVRRLWEAPTFSRQNKAPKDWVCAWDWLLGVMQYEYPERAKYDPKQQARFRDAMHNSVMSLATDVARTSPRAWGVLDPSVECYCSGCHAVRPIEDFDEGYATCRACLESKN